MTFPKKPRRMFRQSEASVATLTLLLAIGATPTPFAASLLNRPALAQSPSPAFPLPSAVPSGTTVRINGSSSLESVNEALKQRFESQFSGTEVEVAYDGSDEALQELLNGNIDVAAIGRPLTEQEQAQGLVAVPVARNKIAMIVGAENPFNASLTSEQFAQMFRGEITSWSQVGGVPAPIRFIDRPDDSDIRQSFQQYPVFQAAPFSAGPNAVRVDEDSVEAAVEELGTDGIGYAIADQVVNNPNVRTLLMHETPPTDPRYPFSQPLAYVYRGPNPSPEVQAFLGFAAAPENQPIVEEARRAGVLAALGTTAQISPSPASPQVSPSPEASPDAAVSPEPEATATAEATPEPSPTAEATPGAVAETEDDRAGVPWWLWLLAIPLLGALLWWLLRDRGAAPVSAPVAAPVAPVGVAPESRIVLTPRDCRDGYVYWEVPDRVGADLRPQDRRLKVRLYDVTDIDLDRQPPHNMVQFDCDDQAQDLHVAIPVDNRDYVAELGYLTEDDRWIQIARSSHVRVPACEPTPDIESSRISDTSHVATGAMASAAAARSISNPQLIEEQSRIILTPRSAKTAYVYWEIPKEHKASLRQQGGRDLRLRIYDTTDIDMDEQSAHNVREYRCDELAQDMHVPIPATDRDYVAELGYATADGRWLRLARSAHVHMPVLPQATRSNVVSNPSEAATARTATPQPSTETAQTIPTRTTAARTDDRRKGSPGSMSDAAKAAGAAIAGGVAAVGTGMAQSVRDRTPSDTTSEAVGTESDLERDRQCRIILVPRTPNAAYAYWEVSDSYKRDLQRQGGQILMLRIHDATDLDIDHQPAHSTQDYVCAEDEQDKHITIPISDRDYIAELGYVTDDGRWLRLIRSFHVRVPSNGTAL